jgi:hypothetical protein
MLSPRRRGGAMVRAKAAAAYDVDHRHGGSWWARWRGYLYVTAGGRARRVDPRFNSRMARRTATCVVPATWQAVRCASAARLSPTIVLYIVLYIRYLQTSLQDSLLYISFLSNKVL